MFSKYISGMNFRLFRFHEAAVDISTRLMGELASAKSKKFEVITNLNAAQLQIIRSSRFWEAMSTNIEVTFDGHGMSLQGTESEIMGFKVRMYEHVVSQIQSRNFPCDQFKLKLLRKPDVTQHFQSVFEQMKLNVACTVSANNVVMHGLDDSSIDKASATLNRELSETKVPLDSASLAALSLSQWKDVVKTLKENAKVLEIAVAADKSSVTCCGISNEVDAAVKEIRTFLQHNAIVEQFISMPEGNVVYIRKHLTSEVDKVVKSLEKDSVKVEPIEDGDRSGFVVRGSSHGVQQAALQLVDLSKDILEVVHDSDLLGTQKYFATKRGKESLTAIENKSRVVVLVSEEQLAEEGDDGVATSLLSGAKRAAPIVKSEVRVTDSNTMIRVLKGSVTDCHAEALIITISEDFKHTDRAARLVAAAGGH